MPIATPVALLHAVAVDQLVGEGGHPLPGFGVGEPRVLEDEKVLVAVVLTGLLVDVAQRRGQVLEHLVLDPAYRLGHQFPVGARGGQVGNRLVVGHLAVDRLGGVLAHVVHAVAARSIAARSSS